MRLLIALAAVLLAACGKLEPAPRTTAYNQCLRQQLFQQCLLQVPKGPERVSNSNDWDEVVGECGTQAKHLSLRPKASIPAECVVDW